MTTIKLLSTGLIAIAMLTATAVARENFAAGRTRVIIRGAPCYMGNSAIWAIPPPRGCWIVWHGIPIWFGPSVRGVPGNICDEGDNARNTLSGAAKVITRMYAEVGSALSAEMRQAASPSRTCGAS